MSSYILIDYTVESNLWWKDLVSSCAIVGEEFEIRCWSDERAETAMAIPFGRKVPSTWRDGNVIRGTITREFIDYLLQLPKPEDCRIYNKMMPFFTLRFGSRMYSEHYGTEIILSQIPEGKTASVEKILNQMEKTVVVHRNVR